jgi:two-component system, NarL family, response regulator DegU
MIRVPFLANRELDVVKALARGNKQISRNLSISGRTVRNHVSNIYRKPRVNGRV